MKNKILFFLLFGTFNLLNAQTKVSGTVTDSNGVTLPGVNISSKNSTINVSTDINGKYLISVSENSTLVFSFIGFSTQEIKVSGKTVINVKLVESSQKLDEIVVIGYGTQKKKDVNSSVSSIGSKDIANLKQVSVDQMLQGKLAGVSVTNSSGQPGAAASVKVRGATSINGTNEPLYIIDGVPISGDATGSSTSGRPIAGNDFSSTGGSGSVAVSAISFLNPNDIETIDVLKDASATAIYGSRGANGVIIITTKSGKKGTGKISYEGTTSVSSIYKYLDVLDLQQYAVYQNNLSALFGAQPRAEFAHPELLGKGTDWQKEVYQTALSHSHQISFSGSNDNTNYYLSTNFLNQEGIILNTGLKRYTLRVNLDSKIKSWLKVGTNITSGISNEKYTVNQSFQGLIGNTLLQSPDMPVRNLDGSFAAPPSSDQNVNYFNPVAEALTKKHNLVRKNFLGNVFAEVDLFKGLKYRVEIAANTEFSENTEFNPQYDRGTQSNATADLFERRQNWYSINAKNLLTYDFGFSKHKFTILLGQEALDSHWEGILGEGHGFKTNDTFGLNLADDTSVTSYKGSSSINSYFGRLLYDFDGRYSLSASIRRDQSSKFDPKGNSQTGYFPSIAASWKVSNEKFMDWLPESISNLKFRAGYGETGNQQIPNNRYSSLLTVYNLPANMNNPELKWEAMQQTNFGVDLTLFNKFNLAFDWYNKKSKDFLFKKPLSTILTGQHGNDDASQYGGIDSPWSNLGSMQNRGFDIAVSYDSKTEIVNWTSNLVFSHYANELLSLADGLSNITRDANLNGYQPFTVTNTVIGQPIGAFYGYKTNGLYRTPQDLVGAPTFNGDVVQLGDVRYIDMNGDGNITDADRTSIGNANPKFTYGFTNTFKYKNVDLSIFIQGSVGNDILNLTRRNGVENASLYKNALVEAMDYWTPSNPDAVNPRPIFGTSNYNIEISDRFVEKGDYARLQNITIGYSIPSSLASKMKLSRFRVYLSAQNIYTLTDYSGYDPEIGSFNQDVLLSGIDNGRYPTPKVFSFGVNLDF
ncbi:MAG: TonB-dependent receptor [Flavobacterium sp.]|uniref:SusC/RagA family TonB-linked outer membrane protein n=1 Tax=Flavobacterium sp. TaxID=239 RepID=UPI0022CA18E6|nr:TonB-dependent receptor [Flavobacterium sp.]MCZ8196925.1 TonB-dependent receptor [Flavobacterium sp.]